MKRWISACATLVLAATTVLTGATLQALTYGHAAAQDGLATVKVNISGLKVGHSTRYEVRGPTLDDLFLKLSLQP